jgi:hypothetical protein
MGIALFYVTAFVWAGAAFRKKNVRQAEEGDSPVLLGFFEGGFRKEGASAW